MIPAYDAVVLVSFGGPERSEDVLPFLRNVTRGRNVPDERLRAVAEHYYQLGGKSPLNDQNLQLIESLKQAFAEVGIGLPIYFGNRNWHPLLETTVREMKDAGVRRALAFVTSAYGSYSGCRQYREDLARARSATGPGAPELHKIRPFFDHPGFVEAMVARVQELIPRFSGESESPRLVFTAHSIPLSMARTAPYEAQLRATCGWVASGVGHPHFDLVWQSRSGPPTVPWLEPDITEHLRDLRRQGVTSVLLVPIGFLSDHMEVIFDLDHEARAVAAELGIHLERASTVGDHPAFVRAVRELVQERLDPAVKPRSMRAEGPSRDLCGPECCVGPVRKRQQLASVARSAKIDAVDGHDGNSDEPGTET